MYVATSLGEFFISKETYMIVTPIKTNRVEPHKTSLLELLDTFLQSMPEKSILAITSKIVSICEGNVIPVDGTDKEVLIQQEASRYLPSTLSKYGISFTIARDTLIPAAGIDESNGGNNYILWPRDPQATANQVRQYLVDRFSLKAVGVVITDSTCVPLRSGTVGTMLGHSGFRALNNYVGTPDLFGRPFVVSKANVASGLAGSAVLTMGEGTEQTPMAVIEEVPFVTFQHRNPTKSELNELSIALEDDLFGPFLTSVDWLPGAGGKSHE